MALRKLIVDAAAEICAFNRKLTFARLGPEGLDTYSISKDIYNQALLVSEETREFEKATSVLDMVDGAIDMLVTEVWLDVLQAAFQSNHKRYTIEEAIELTLDRYQYEPLHLRCIDPMIMLYRLGVNLQGATLAVLNDNNTKFVSEVKACADSVKNYREVLKIECEARPVDHYKREWGLFRLPDLKLLKPNEYRVRALRGQGLNILPTLPKHLQAASTTSLDAVAGNSTINTFITRSS